MSSLAAAASFTLTRFFGTHGGEPEVGFAGEAPCAEVEGEGVAVGTVVCAGRACADAGTFVGCMVAVPDAGAVVCARIAPVELKPFSVRET